MRIVSVIAFHLMPFSARIKQLEGRMAQTAQLKMHIINCSKTKDVYAAYKKSLAGQSVLAWDFFAVRLLFCLKMLLFVQRCGKLFLDVAIDGRRLALLEIPEGLRPSVYIETRKGIWERRAHAMLTLEGLIAVLSLCIGCFSLGYAIGSRDNDKTQK